MLTNLHVLTLSSVCSYPVEYCAFLVSFVVGSVCRNNNRILTRQFLTSQLYLDITKKQNKIKRYCLLTTTGSSRYGECFLRLYVGAYVDIYYERNTSFTRPYTQVLESSARVPRTLFRALRLLLEVFLYEFTYTWHEE